MFKSLRKASSLSSISSSSSSLTYKQYKRIHCNQQWKIIISSSFHPSYKSYSYSCSYSRPIFKTNNNLYKRSFSSSIPPTSKTSTVVNNSDNQITENPKKANDTFQTLQRILNLAKPEWNLILGAVATLGMTSTVTLIYPYASGQVIDLAILTDGSSISTSTNTSPNYLYQLSMGLFGLTMIAGTGVYIRSILLTKAGNLIVARMRKQLFTSILAQEIYFFDTMPTGDLLSRLTTDAVLIQKAVTTEVVNALRAIIMSIGSCSLLFYTSPTLAIVSLCSLPPVFVAARYFGRQLKDQQHDVQMQLANATDVAEEVIQGIRTVRQFASESHEIQRYHHILTDAHEKAIHAGKIQAIFDGTVHIAANGAILGVLAYGGSMVSSGDMSGTVQFRFFFLSNLQFVRWILHIAHCSYIVLFLLIFVFY